MKRFRQFLFIAFGACIGCGGPSARYDATVEGTVTVDGQLASRGRVMFHPVKEGPPAYGSIFPNGTYSLRVGQGDLEEVDGGKLPSGDYLVTVVVNMPSIQDETVGAGGPPKPGAQLMAAKYADKSTTDLRRTVKPGRNVFPLELEGAAVEAKSATPADEEAANASNGTSAATEPQDEPTTAAPKDAAAAPTAAPAEESKP